MKERLTPDNCLPVDDCAGALLGRVWIPGDPAGPVPVAVRDAAFMTFRRWSQRSAASWRTSMRRVW